MKIASWNVNSVRARLGHLQQWLTAAMPDVVLLQETKSKDEDFPVEAIAAAGYHSVYYGQPAYNGVAILSATPAEDVVRGNPYGRDEAQARIIAARIAGVCVLSVYVPNGQVVGSEKYDYKLAWLEDFAVYLQALAGDVTVAGGDYNIAPTDADIYDAEAWGEGILASPKERAAFANVLACGYSDAQPLFERQVSFTWWDYRAAAFARNHGLRIDLMLLSDAAKERARACAPDKTPRSWQRPSDHAPVVLRLD